jgi:SAM-dependent methyltransferase
MHYDPVKDRLGAIFQRSPLAQKAFYRLLDAFFLRAWHVHRELLRRFPDKSAPLRILDAGTGFGQYAYFLARQYPNARILAVDVKHDYLATFRRFLDQTAVGSRVETRYEDLTDLQVDPERDGYFDLALSVDVMEHIEDDRGVFRHFERVLKPGGYVLINTPSDQGGSDVGEEGETSFIEEHVRDGYAPGELGEKLRREGLEPVHWRYTYGRYGSLAWRWLIKRPISALNRSMALAPLVALYYVPVAPASMALHALDVRTDNEKGTGLLMVAQKPTG